jgi:hypothetical protein
MYLAYPAVNSWLRHCHQGTAKLTAGQPAIAAVPTYLPKASLLNLTKEGAIA